MMTEKTKRGALIVNTGTPDAPTPEAVRAYLQEFLSDPRICPMPPAIWQLILRSFILPKRSHASAAKYAGIWREDGSPLAVHMRSLAAKLEASFEGRVPVRHAMSYGMPSMREALAELKDASCEELVVIPLYPQSAHSTTLVVKDKVEPTLRQLAWNPSISFVESYCDQPGYVAAVADSIAKAGMGEDDRLLLAFHSIPMRDIERGDTYADQVERSVQAIVDQAGLASGQWVVGFQCRFDKSRSWLGPATSEALQSLSSDGGRLFVVAPNFSIDCLETLYDIEVELRQKIAELDGMSDPSASQRASEMRYIPCQNDSDAHVALLRHIVEEA